MPKPPTKKTLQTDYVKSALRLPPSLHEELVVAAARNGHSLNAEILSRCRADQLDAVMAELADLKRMMRAMMDQM
jgi:predicted HicB family RNase H-like nuclease